MKTREEKVREKVQYYWAFKKGRIKGRNIDESLIFSVSDRKYLKKINRGKIFSKKTIYPIIERVGK